MTIPATEATGKLSLEVTAHGQPFTVTGQLAKALAALVKADARGVTALEVASWAYRLGAYVHTLRHDYRLEIVTHREEHPGGWHARYELKTPVQLDKT